MPDTTVTVQHPEGLHARPAALLVSSAQQFQSDIQVILGDWIANAKSILDVLALGANQGATILIKAEGEDAEEALSHLEELVRNNFGDEIE